jgi:hypothetical protein
MALPCLLKELKANGYNVVHVVAVGERPKSIPELMALPALTESLADRADQRAHGEYFDHSTKPPHQESGG